MRTVTNDDRSAAGRAAAGGRRRRPDRNRGGRGRACTGARTVVCDLDFLSGNLVASVDVAVRVVATGEIVAVATAQATPVDADPSNNVATARVRPPTVATRPRAPSARKGVVRTGTAGADTLRGGPFADVLRGLGGADRLWGSAASTGCSAGPARTRFAAGTGTIRSRPATAPGTRWSAAAAGRDVVVADRLDRVARDCETVRR